MNPRQDDPQEHPICSTCAWFADKDFYIKGQGPLQCFGREHSEPHTWSLWHFDGTAAVQIQDEHWHFKPTLELGARHAAWLLNRYKPVRGAIPYELVHCRPFRGVLADFAEPIYA